MDTAPLILDLDISKSIKDLGIYINTNYLPDTILKLVGLIKKYGKYNGLFARDVSDVEQYLVPVKYLNNILTIFFEFDSICQFITIGLYNKENDKYHLKIFISINEEPNIKYIESDKTGYIPYYAYGTNIIKPGEYLVNFSHCLLNYIGYQRVRLDDDSYLIMRNIDDIEIRAKLWLYLLITKEKSWYSKFGYEPSNSTTHEYSMKIKDVQHIRLNEVSNKLKIITTAQNKYYINHTIIEISNLLLKIIGNSTQTLEEYTKSHTILEFANLTNNLFQSIYSKKINVNIYSQTNSGDNDSTVEPISIQQELDFPWYEKYIKLFIGNVCQTNNNISKWFHIK